MAKRAKSGTWKESEIRHEFYGVLVGRRLGQACDSVVDKPHGSLAWLEIRERVEGFYHAIEFRVGQPIVVT